ncbi:MAG: uL15m family ribosomal protein [Candidatus Syntropharchaeia archaeon]
MPKKRVKKIRGTRTCGGGTHKNRRGGGSRGGRGNAGVYKHHIVRSLKRGIVQGKHGFKRPSEVIEEKKVINVGEIDEKAENLLSSGLAKMMDDGIYIDAFDLGFDKVLGRGAVTKKLIIRAPEFSENAKMKIEEKGGMVILE